MGNPFQSTSGSNNFTSGTSSGMTNSSGSSTVTPNENPLFTQFRESLLPAIAQQYEAAQKPVYGAAQEGQFVNQANNTYNLASQGAQNNAARRGVANSGAADASQTALDQQRAGQISNFYSQIPLINQQNSFNQTQSLLGLASSFLGQSPIGSTTTGSSQGNTFGTQMGTGSGSQWGSPSIMQDIGSIASIF